MASFSQRRAFGQTFDDDDNSSSSSNENSNPFGMGNGDWQNRQHPMAAGVIAGIVVACVIFLSIIFSILFYFIRRNQQVKAFYAYGVKDSLPSGASLEDGRAGATRSAANLAASVRPNSPAGPPPPYQPPVRPPAAVLSPQLSSGSPSQPNFFQFESSQHLIDANHAQTMDGSYSPHSTDSSFSGYSTAKTSELGSGTERSELSGESSTDVGAIRRK